MYEKLENQNKLFGFHFISIVGVLKDKNRKPTVFL